MDLVVAPCSRKAAEYAVMHWHYSQKMPAGKLITLGAWEGGRYIGAVIYGRGANNRLGQPYGLNQSQVVELVRVALTGHTAPVSQIVAETLRALRATNPGLRLVVSYADPEQGHHGGIYQAGNWIYTGTSTAQSELIIGGKFVHKRTAHALYGTASPERIAAVTGKTVTWSPVYWKHTYLMPLDRAMRRQIWRLRKTPPTRELGLDGETSSVQLEGAGSTPAARSILP